VGRFVGLRRGRGIWSAVFRVQVKSTSYRLANGYLCGFRPNQHSKPYTVKQIDFFAGYIVPEDAWYVIPAVVVLKTRSLSLMLCPVQPMRRDCYRYEGYREAWKLLRGGTR
jgi:hypothetical protein